MKCCQDGVCIGHCHVQFSRTKHMGVPCIVVEKWDGMIVIIVSSHDTILSVKIGIHT